MLPAAIAAGVVTAARGVSAVVRSHSNVRGDDIFYVLDRFRSSEKLPAPRAWARVLYLYLCGKYVLGVARALAGPVLLIGDY